MKKIIIATFTLLALTACTHNKVEVNKVDDSHMTCNQINHEIMDMKVLMKDIDGKRGFSGRNVGMALVFWPGIIVNEMNGSEAETLVKERMDKLVKMHEKKQCN